MRFVVKLALFSLFVTVLYFTIGLVVNNLSSLISSKFNVGNNVLYILHKLKICEAVNIFLSAYIGTWIVNKIINYWAG